VVLDGVDVTDEIRSPEVNRAVSTVAAHPGVRSEMVRRQRRWAQEHGGGVIEGRDIGTVVFPDAELKVFLTASEPERARRRNEEAEVAQRDRRDATRATSPMQPAPDALVLDTTGMAVDDVVALVLDRL
jgi:cytidylate kinase